MDIIRHEPGKFFSAAVEANGMVFVAGQIADDLTQDVRGQTAQVLTKIDRLLAGAGTDKSRILSANIWLPDIGTRDDMNAAWSAWADAANLPARATVEARLAQPDILVEIMVVAAKR